MKRLSTFLNTLGLTMHLFSSINIVCCSIIIFIFVSREAGFSVKTIRYYDWKTGGLDSKGLYEDLKASIPKML